MGNHVVGQMFVAGISNLSDNDIEKLTQEKALALLDKIGKRVIEETSLDAEFNDHLNPDQRLGKIVLKAFCSEKYDDWKDKRATEKQEDL